MLTKFLWIKYKKEVQFFILWNSHLLVMVHQFENGILIKIQININWLMMDYNQFSFSTL